MKSVLYITYILLMSIASILYISCTYIKSSKYVAGLQQYEEIIALQNGIGYLMRTQNKQGHWMDFDCDIEPGGFWQVGISDQWVTGTVVACLRDADINLDIQNLDQSCETAERWLMRSVRKHGWGWNVAVDPDADSTAWVLRTNLGKSNAELALLSLADYQRDDGGIATYASRSKGEWSIAHPDVTANMILSLHVNGHASHGVNLESAVRYLVDQQKGDGHWDAYWWDSTVYTTALAGEVLLNEIKYQHVLNKAVNYIKRSQNIDGGWGKNQSNTIDTALCLRFISTIVTERTSNDLEKYRKKGIEWLCSHQNADGSWPSSKLLLPPSSLSGIKGENVKCADSISIFSSALAVSALSKSVTFVH